ncbi:LuxR C-terminal-related transcriptional regulator [Streptomyces sp. 1222.5]|uniref:LuxR C-terminal-related transcriptional regulator n=1 Tax=Streptomyces sp. 1222.5 TaxID=1881026 RepID=UPI003EBEA8B7
MAARPSMVLDRLTPAQDLILHKIANGLDTEATAVALNITRGTVSVQMSSMSRRLRVSGLGALTVLGDSAFSDVTETVLPVRQTWNVEQVVGYLYSTSFAAPHLFMERRGNFESAVKTVLAEYAASDVLAEDNAFTVLTARRPSSREGR